MNKITVRQIYKTGENENGTCIEEEKEWKKKVKKKKKEGKRK